MTGEHLTALCCVCGATRQVTTRIRRQSDYPEGLHRIGESADGGPRCTVMRKCAPCGEDTLHAYLLTGPGRDSFEECIYRYGGDFVAYFRGEPSI